MAAHGEKTWPSVGNFSGRPWGGSHGRRHVITAKSQRLTPGDLLGPGVVGR